MTRDKFLITWRDESTIKFKWNSSIRETERIIREIANDERAVFTLVHSESNKEDGYFANGSRTWESDTGETVTFKIQKL